MKIRSRQKGGLILIAIVLIVVLGVFGVTAIRTFTSSTEATINLLGGRQADFLAESGLEDGLYEIKTTVDPLNPTAYCNNVYQATQTLGAGQFRFKCLRYTASVTVGAAITAASTVIRVSTLTNMAPLGRVLIDSENIDYDGTSTNAAICGTAPCLIVRTRGANGTTAAVHALGATVTQSQFILQSDSFVPSLAFPTAQRTLLEAFTINYPVVTDGWAVGNNGSIYRRNSSAVWNPVSVSTSVDFNDVSCTSTTNCWLVGTVGGIYRWNGTTWTNVTSTYLAVFLRRTLNAVSCATTNACWVLDTAGRLYQWNGATWALNVTFSGTNSISCPASNFCIGVGTSGNIRKWNGTSWASVTSPTSNALNSVSCPTTTYCAAVGAGGRIIQMVGSTWSIVTSPTGTALNTVSCGNASNCWAFGTAQAVNARNLNGTWAGASVSISGLTINDVYCATPTQCFIAFNRTSANQDAVGEWNGTSWALATVTADPGNGENLNAASSDLGNTGGSTALTIDKIGWLSLNN